MPGLKPQPGDVYWDQGGNSPDSEMWFYVPDDRYPDHPWIKTYEMVPSRMKEYESEFYGELVLWIRGGKEV